MFPKYQVGMPVIIIGTSMFPKGHPIEKQIGKSFVIRQRVNKIFGGQLYQLDIPGAGEKAWFEENDLEYSVSTSSAFGYVHQAPVPKGGYSPRASVSVCSHPNDSVVVSSADGIKFRYCRKCKTDLGNC
jgi:hypothetical protein